METSLIILDKIKLIPQKGIRSTELLADFSTGYAKCSSGEEWYFCVPKCFYEALDIRYTTRKKGGEEKEMWTQGSWFNFSEGDKIYNHAYGYCNNFIGGLNRPKICLSIESARPSKPLIKNKPKSKMNNEEEGKERYSGEINFKIMAINPKTTYWATTRNETLSQDDFIELLIKGLPDEWNIN